MEKKVKKYIHEKRIRNGEQQTLEKHSVKPIKKIVKKQIRMGGFTAHGKLI